MVLSSRKRKQQKKGEVARKKNIRSTSFLQKIGAKKKQRPEKKEDLKRRSQRLAMKKADLQRRDLKKRAEPPKKP